MMERLQNILKEAKEKLALVQTQNELNETRAYYMGKKSPLGEILKQMGSLSIEEKKTLGSYANTVKQEIEACATEKRKELERAQTLAKLEKEKIDITLPGKDFKAGTKHPLTQVIEEVEDIFIGMGYNIAEGPEVEEDIYNFEMLNVPKGHPARDMQDSFYITENLLVRTQTSPVQVRTMLKAHGEPIKILCPGKTYRRDDDDATHSHQFMQFEGLVVDKGVSLCDLKGLLDEFVKIMFDGDTKTRFRPSYFPFTEPSVEVDVTCCKCHGKGCSLCKGTGWIEILGAGVVNKNVLEMSGIDSNEYSGLAFGLGIERITMIKYGISDIRTLFENNVKFLKQFNRR